MPACVRLLWPPNHLPPVEAEDPRRLVLWLLSWLRSHPSAQPPRVYGQMFQYALSQLRYALETIIYQVHDKCTSLLVRESQTSLQIWRSHAVLIAYSSIILVARLWKKPRIHLKAICASILILSPSHKIAIASYFTSTYHVSLTLIF
ncbi:hypothetical protein C8R48DRAFT_421242 [Suillus tomentosus]|nr:hypothetical protein C8R48DRAFT_421242 [Suillus tomentosus]